MVHGLITLAGAVVLTMFPTAIPSVVGIKLERADYLLVYLVAAAELAVAVLSFGAARLTDRRALGVIVTTLVVLHLSSGILNLVYMGLTGFNGTMIALTVLRFTVVVVFLVAWRFPLDHTPGTEPVVRLCVPCTADAASCRDKAPSSLIRRASTPRPTTTNNSPQYEPRASGVPIIKITFPKYMGCRTNPYQPVEHSC